jgi:TPR repeat protein
MLMKRVENNDPVAMMQMGGMRANEGDYVGAFEYNTKASELGVAGAHYNLSIMYDLGQVLRRMRKRKSTIWKRPPLAVKSAQGTISDVMRRDTVALKGQ